MSTVGIHAFFLLGMCRKHSILHATYQTLFPIMKIPLSETAMFVVYR